MAVAAVAAASSSSSISSISSRLLLGAVEGKLTALASTAASAGSGPRRRAYSRGRGEAAADDLPSRMENPYREPLKKCILCGVHVDYKNVQLLSQFISPFTGCVYGRHITGLCGRKQKELAKAIKRAHIMGFMSVTYKDPTFLKDPKICNIKYRE
ncbi:28S ribosomal protein S18c, mitochondrial [Ornithorhynchus anatinus]|uniref:28S ribosomal protein S18c, mitochondrial n=1 Tax=Ornithorhynchus anatinus TaxID=9258 RepID=UPI0010A845F9|nr:28S ribosomal protein S18c, mitochondrial [Ornithorhynchus anatinus]